jgi:recombination protein RecA
MTAIDDKKAKIKATLEALNKEYGKGSVGVYGDLEKIDVETISTGSLTLDHALGCGGYARGRIVEIWGQEAAGKSTLTLHAIAEAQKRGGLCAFIDAEHALDPVYASNLGVRMNDVVLSQPDSGEQALETVEALITSGAFDIVVVDSVAALVPKAEIEGEMGDSHVGLQARLMSQACRKLSPIVSRSKTVLIFVNQLRQKIGIAYGDPNVTTGGNSLKYYASQRLQISRTGSIKDGDSDIGNRVKVKVVKNKLAAPFKVCEFDIMFGKGINRVGEVFDGAVTLNLIEKSGSWYSYQGEKLGQGRENCCEILASQPKLLQALEAEVRKQLRVPGV